MTVTHRILPLLAKLCATIDESFVEVVGPFAPMVIEESRTTWLATGNKTHPRDVNVYIALLAKEIENPARRADFASRARQILGNSLSRATP
jgi:hypothetical protein